MPKKKKIKRILSGTISHLSLCPKGANLIETVYKAEDNTDVTVKIETVCKDMTEQGEIFAVVYAPEMVDHQGDIASAEAIKKMAYSFSKDGLGIDILHDEKVLSKDDVYIAQSYIASKSDPNFSDTKDYDGNPVDVDGAWVVVMKVDNQDLREKYRTGVWKGISLGGMVLKVEDEPVEDEVMKVDSFFKKLCSLFEKANKISNSKIEDIDMTPEQIEKMQADITKAVVEEVTKALKDGSTVEKKEGKEQKIEKSMADGTIEPTLDIVRKQMEDAAEEGVTVADEDVVVMFAKAKKVYDLAANTDRMDPEAISAYYQARKAILSSENKEESGCVWQTAQKTTQIEGARVVKNTKETPLEQSVAKSMDKILTPKTKA